jgi:hypothetical protein
MLESLATAEIEHEGVVGTVVPETKVFSVVVLKYDVEVVDPPDDSVL